MTNYEYIKNMDIDKMAAFITEVNIKSNPKLKKANAIVKYVIAKQNKHWLKSEAKVNEDDCTNN
jgi:hypothetical protein